MHKKWSEKETPEELREDLEAMKEEKELSEQLKGPGPLCNTSGNIFWNFNFWAWQACSCRILRQKLCSVQLLTITVESRFKNDCCYS